MKKKLLAMLLTLAMVMAYMPAFVFADGEADDPEGQDAPAATELTEESDTQEAVDTEEQEEAVIEEPGAETAAADEKTDAEAEPPAPEKSTSPAPLRSSVDTRSAVTLTGFTYEPYGQHEGYIGTAMLVDNMLANYRDKIVLNYSDGSKAIYKFDGLETFVFDESSSTHKDPDVVTFYDWDISWEFTDEEQTAFTEGANNVTVILYYEYEEEDLYSSNSITVTGAERPAAVTAMEYIQDENNIEEHPLEAYVGVRLPNDLTDGWPEYDDRLKVSFSDGSEIVFTYGEGNYGDDFYDEDGKNLFEHFESCGELEFKEGQEAFEEGPNTLDFYIIDYPSFNSRENEDLDPEDFKVACPVTVTGVVSNVQSITFTQGHPPIELEQEEFMDAELEYDFGHVGDKLKVNYKDGTSNEFVYYEEDGFVDKNGSDDPDEWIDPDTIDYYDDQENNTWTEGYYSITVNYQGVETVVENAVHVTKTPHEHDIYFDDGYEPVPLCEDGGEDGLKPHYFCERCGRYFSDQAATKEISEDSLVIPAPAHHWEFLKVVKKATTTAKGQRQYECGYCSAKQTREDIPKATAPAGVPVLKNTVANSAKKTNDVIWDKSKVKNATNYELSWRTRGSSTWKKTNVGNTVRGVTTGLSIGGLYEIKVRPYRSTSTEIAYGSESKPIYRYFHTTGKIRLASNSKGSFTMSWAKNSAATGYQILYTTNKNGSGAANNMITINNANTTSITRKTIFLNGKTQALKSGTTYYVQVREIKKVGTITYIGNISCPVAVKVK